MTFKTLLTSLATTALLTCTTSAAFACVHGMEEDANGNPVVSEMTAEQNFYSQVYRDAVGHMLTARPEFAKHSKGYLSSDDDLYHYTLLAAAVVRLDGKINLKNNLAKRTSSKKVVAKNIEWATQILEHAHKQDPKNVELTSWLGEAYALDSKSQDRALATLAPLAQSTSLADGKSWMVYARLQQASGASPEELERSLESCKLNAMDDSICTLGKLKTTKRASTKRVGTNKAELKPLL